MGISAHCHSFDYNSGIISTEEHSHATVHTVSLAILLHSAGTNEKGYRQPVSRNVEGTGDGRPERENRAGARG
jgi:hypothetical protein